MVLYLIRHGETDMNAANYVQGCAESDLNENGKWQAQKIAERLSLADERPTRIYASPLRRAADTAAVTSRAIGLDPTYDPSLVEMHCGGWEGLNFDAIKAERPDEFLAWATSPDSSIPGGGESIRDLYVRAAASIDRILAEAAEEDRIAIFSHGGVNRVLLSHLLGLDLQIARRCYQDNGSISLFVRRNGLFFMDRWNDTSHLVGGPNGRPFGHR